MARFWCLVLTVFWRVIGNWSHEPEFDERPAVASLRAPGSDDRAEETQSRQLAKQGVEQSPPPVFQPMRQDPWPHFEDDSGVTAQLMHQQIRNRLNSSFLLVVNGAHRQAMNDLEAMNAT